MSKPMKAKIEMTYCPLCDRNMSEYAKHGEYGLNPDVPCNHMKWILELIDKRLGLEDAR